MKKSLLLTLAASAMLCASVFTGCSDLPEEYYPSAETKAAQAAAEKAAKKPAVPAGATAIVDFTKMADSSTLSGSGATLVEDTTFKDGTHVLSVSEKSWQIACAKLSNAVDLTGKKVYVLAKGASAADTGNNDGVAFFVASNNTGDASDDGEAWTARSDKDFQLTNASEFKEYEFNLDEFGKHWKASEKADNTAINYVGFRLKSAKFGTFQVAAIYYK